MISHKKYSIDGQLFKIHHLKPKNMNKIHIYMGDVNVESFMFDSEHFYENIEKFKQYLKEEFLPPFREFSFINHKKHLSIANNLTLFKEYLTLSEEINIYSSVNDILYPISIILLPIGINTQTHNYDENSKFISIKRNIMSFTFNSLLKDINNNLNLNRFNFVKEFYFLHENGNITLMNKIIAKRLFEDVIYSLRSRYPEIPGIIIVNTELMF